MGEQWLPSSCWRRLTQKQQHTSSSLVLTASTSEEQQCRLWCQQKKQAATALHVCDPLQISCSDQDCAQPDAHPASRSQQGCSRCGACAPPIPQISVVGCVQAGHALSHSVAGCASRVHLAWRCGVGLGCCRCWRCAQRRCTCGLAGVARAAAAAAATQQ